MQNEASNDFGDVQTVGDQSPTPAVPQLLVEAADTFNYAAWQNAVPLLRGITINNPSGEELSSVVIELTASPAFARSKRWTIDRVHAGGSLRLVDVDIDIDPSFLDSLDEAERGMLSFQLVHGGQPIHAVNHSVRVLARDEWGGMPSMGELLAAFVTPNDPASHRSSDPLRHCSVNMATRRHWMDISRAIRTALYACRIAMVCSRWPILNLCESAWQLRAGWAKDA